MIPVCTEDVNTREEEEMTLKTKLAVVMDLAIYQQIMTYIRAIDFECSGLGHVEKHGDLIKVVSVNLPKQEGTEAGTELDAEAVNAMMVQAVKEGDMRAQNFWWHSHVKGGTFWSTTDNDNCDRLSQGSGLFVSIVGNQQGEMRCRVDFSNPTRITIDELPVYITHSFRPHKNTETWTKQVKTHVKKREITYTGTWNGYHQSKDQMKIYGLNDDWYNRQYGEVYEIRPSPTHYINLEGKLKKIEDKTELKTSYHTHNCHAKVKHYAECELCDIVGCVRCSFNTNGKELNGWTD